MDDTCHNTSRYAHSITNDIVGDASLLGDGTNHEIFDNIGRLKPFQEKVISVLHTKDQDWALRTVLDILPTTHRAVVAFLKSNKKGQEIYNDISSFIKRCFMCMALNNDNLDIYRSLIAFYYSEKTTIVMLPKSKVEFLHTEFDECKKDYDKIDSLGHRIDKLKVAYRMYEIVSGIKTNISKHMVTQKINQINSEGNLNSEQYVDFDLHIAPNGHAVASSVEGQATAQISLKIPNTIELALSLIEARQANTKLLKQIGQAFYDWLFPGPVHTHFHQTEAVARRENRKMRLRLRIEAEKIVSLPLEFLYRETRGYFVAINPDTILSRYLNLPLPPERVRRRDGPLHMLAIIADPTDQTRLPPDQWEAIIKDALSGPLANGQMTLQTVKRATRKEIRNALLQQKPDIIQFVGHGTYQDDKGYLALVDDQTGKTWLVDDERFANLYLGYGDHLGLISLATCESAQSDNPQGFLGIAPKLVQRGVPAVLAMQYEVLITTAKIFLEEFYTTVAARKPIDWATQSARNAVSQELGLDNREFATPVLYMRAQDGNVF